jgi:calcineurin-like phosphoesterase family protein
MRIAVLSDVHGNLVALEAVMAELDRQAADAVWVLGDLVGGPASGDVVDLVRREATIVVAGDRDRATVDEAGDLLAAGQLLWLASLPEVDHNWRAELRHALPGAVAGPVPGRRAAAAALVACPEPFLVVGHSGQAAVYVVDAAGEVTGGAVDEAGWVDISKASFVLNPGAVGGQQAADGTASWLMIDTETDRAEFNQIGW